MRPRILLDDADRVVVSLLVVLATAGIYVWSLADSHRVEDLLFLANASIYTDPWRILTSTFIHRIAPHFAFNLLTLWWFGREVERRFGARLFALTFFGGLWTGHLLILALGMLPFHGVSGGVCGLYGFLLVADWAGNPYKTIAQRPAYWLYLAALFGLFVADRAGLTPVANLNHLVGISYGALLRLATTSRRHRASWLSAAASVMIAITACGVYVWEAPWTGLAPVARLNCEARKGPAGRFTTQSFVRVIVVDPDARRKSISYITSDGKRVLESTNNRRTYRLLPYVSTVWTVDDADGQCQIQFEASTPGTLRIEW